MTRYVVYCCAALLTIVSLKASNAGVNVNIDIGGQGHDSYYGSIADYYGINNDDIYYMRRRGIPDERIPAILQIASSANVSPLVVARRYGPGVSLMELTRFFGLTPEIYYVPVKVRVDGPPYGKAYGYYRNRARKEWKNIYLDDYDIINLSNLRFMSRHYDIEPDIIIKKRSSGKNFIVINDDFHKYKKSKHKNGVYKYHEEDDDDDRKDHWDDDNDYNKNQKEGKEKSKGNVKGNGKSKGKGNKKND